ncbi:MAG: alanine dehydrogenase [Bacteroidia bacterium]|nr:alanine dehydrogenase [Bacteroidia bacterium]
MKIGIIRERKSPPDKRVPFTPAQCAEITKQYPMVELVVESSDIRCFSDGDYTQQGIRIVNDVSDCDILFGVKEVPIDHLIPNKTYFYFSHTIKEQPYNRNLLRSMLRDKIQMVDYEALTHEHGGRILGFGRYAGIVGAYNGLLAHGLRSGLYNLKPAHQCEDRVELEQELTKVVLPKGFKTLVTGTGRVGQGAVEILEKINYPKVSAETFLSSETTQACYCVVDVDAYYKRDDGQPFDISAFFKDPAGHSSDFMKFARTTDLYIACHFWDSRAPFIFTRQDMRDQNWKIDLVADISCDIDGPVASTIRPSTIAKPLYGYDINSEQETAFDAPSSIGVMAVDNLPCELPKDASLDFGRSLIDHVLPALLESDDKDIIGRASICKDGKLTSHFEYLTYYVS